MWRAHEILGIVRNNKKNRKFCKVVTLTWKSRMHTAHRSSHVAASLTPRSETPSRLVPSVVLGNLGVQPPMSIGVPTVQVKVPSQGALGQRPPSNKADVIVVVKHYRLVALLMDAQLNDRWPASSEWKAEQAVCGFHGTQVTALHIITDFVNERCRWSAGGQSSRSGR